VAWSRGSVYKRCYLLSRLVAANDHGAAMANERKTPRTSSPTLMVPEATVIAVGPGAPNKEGVVQPVSVTVGDRVLLPGWGGNAIKVGEDVRRRR
jgi:hypothetical protein